MKKALLLGLSLLTALVLAETVVRVAGYHPRLIDPHMFQANSDPLLPYTLKPNYQGHYVGGRVTINSNGHRNVVPECAGSALLILGDSIVFGQGLSDEETLSSQLQKQLCGQFRIKTIAAPGYSTWNEFAALRDYPDPLARVVLVYVPNDVTFENDHLKIRGDEIADLSNSRLHRLLRKLYANLYVSSLLADSIKRLRHRDDLNVGPLDSAALAYSMQAIDEIQKLANSRGFRFSVAIYRDIWHYGEPELSLRYETAVREQLQKRSIETFVLKSHLEQLNIGDVRVHFNDPHPSPRATELMVGDVMSALKR